MNVQPVHPDPASGSTPPSSAPRRPSSRSTRERLLLLLLAAALAGILVGNQWGILTPDTKPEIYLAPWHTASVFARWWIDGPFLGTANYNVGLAPVAAVVGVIELVFPEPWFAMRIWRLLLLLIAAWGARRLFRELVRGTEADTVAARVAVAIAYVAHPYLLLGGATTPTLMPLAGLPWLCLFWLRSFRRPSWRWPASAALVVAGMGGMNAGAVIFIQSIVLFPLIVHARRVEKASWAGILNGLVRTALLALPMALYWLVPALSGLRVGSSVAAGTESLEAINNPNSFAEVLRGLGFWTLYGRDASGPFVPTLTGYLDSPWVVLASFGPLLVAVLALAVSRSTVRLVGALMVAVAAVVMVGAYPWGSSSALGRAMIWGFDHVPGLIALRTTNKAGAVLVLGTALLVGLTASGLQVRWGMQSRTVAGDGDPVRRRARVSAWRRRWSGLVWRIPGRSTRRMLASVVPFLVALPSVLSVASAASGRLFPVEVDIPGYWREAAAAVDSSGGAGRVLLTPGVGSTTYQWGYRGFDELGGSLFTRPTVHRAATPVGTPYASALLGGVDVRLQGQSLPAGSMSALADYIGAGTVLGRYDQVFEGPMGGAVDGALRADPGLAPEGAWGPEEAGSGASAALRAYAVTSADAQAPVRAHSVGDAVIIDGDGSALPDLVPAGLLDRRPALLIAGSMTPEQLRIAVRDGARVVLTDSNGRRDWSAQRPAVTGALVRADQTPTTTHALFDAPDQTVLREQGVRSLETEGQGLLFGPFGGGSVTNAFDGERATAWRFGNFGTGAGNAVTVSLTSPTTMDRVLIGATNEGGNRVTKVRVTASGPDGARADATADLEAWASLQTTVPLTPGRYDRVRVEVLEVDPHGIGPVGLSEISIPGVVVRAVARTPVALSDELRSWTGASAEVLERTPIDVVLRRQGGATEMSQQEAELDRDIALPSARTFSAAGTVRLSPTASDEEIDAVAGVTPDVRVTSSSRFDADPTRRGSAALDGTSTDPDLTTGWSPAQPVVGEWLQADFSERQLSSFTLTQSGESTITRVWVRLNDGAPFSASLGSGTSTITLPRAQAVHRVQIIITDRALGGPVLVTDLGLPHVIPTTARPDCRAVGAIDDAFLTMRLKGALADLLRGEAVPAEGCAPIPLSAGGHRIRALSDLVLDDLRLMDTAHPVASAKLATTEPTVTVLDTSSSESTVRVEGGCEPCLVSPGQGFDPRWSATADGRSLGAPLVLDGYAVGWRIDVPDGTVVTMSYGPQAWALTTWLLSLAGVLVAAALALLPIPALGRRWPVMVGLARRLDPPMAIDRDSGLGSSMARRRRLPRSWSARAWRQLAVSSSAVAVPVAAAVTSPPVVALGVLLIGCLVALVPRIRSVLPTLAMLGAVLLVAVWFVGVPEPLGDPGRAANNLAAHGLGALTLWLMLLAALYPPVPTPTASIPPTPEDAV